MPNCTLEISLWVNTCTPLISEIPPLHLQIYYRSKVNLWQLISLPWASVNLFFQWSSSFTWSQPEHFNSYWRLSYTLWVNYHLPVGRKTFEGVRDLFINFHKLSLASIYLLLSEVRVTCHTKVGIFSVDPNSSFPGLVNSGLKSGIQTASHAWSEILCFPFDTSDVTLCHNTVAPLHIIPSAVSVYCHKSIPQFHLHWRSAVFPFAPLPGHLAVFPFTLHILLVSHLHHNTCCLHWAAQRYVLYLTVVWSLTSHCWPQGVSDCIQHHLCCVPSRVSPLGLNIWQETIQKVQNTLCQKACVVLNGDL